MPSVLRTLMNLLGYVLAFWVVFRYWKQIGSIFLKDMILVLMLGVSVLSILWAVEPETTIESVRALLRTTILGIYFTALYSPSDQRKLLFKILLLWGLGSLFAAAIPGYGITASGKHAGDLVGLFSFKNSSGEYMSLAAILSLSVFLIEKENRKLSLISLVVAPMMVLWSGSVTSLMALFAAFSILPLYFFSNLSFRSRTVLYIVVFTFGISGILLVSANLETIVVDWLGKDLTFTGRSSLWEAIIRQGLERPVLGFGLGGFWDTEYAVSAAFENAWPSLPKTGMFLDGLHSHNGFIEIFVQLGFVGLCLSLTHFVFLFFRLVRLCFSKKNRESLWMLQFLILIFFINLTEAGSILEPSALSWLLYVDISLAFRQLNLKDACDYNSDQSRETI